MTRHDDWHRRTNLNPLYPPHLDAGRYIAAQSARRAWTQHGRALLWSLLAVALAVLMTAACGGVGGADDQDGPAPGSPEALGVNTDLGPRLDPDGNPVPEDQHPLSRTYRTLAPLSELYYAGIRLGGADQGLLDDAREGWARLHSDDDGSWTQNPMAAGKGDVDGDGYDEIVVAYLVAADQVIKLRVVDREGGAYVATTHTVVTNLEATGGASLPPLMAIALGDLDRDGRDEIAVGIGHRLYLLDDANAGYAKKEEHAYDMQKENGLALMQLGMGDFSGDGQDQLLVSMSLLSANLTQGSVAWYRYDQSLTEANDHGELTLRLDYETHTFALARMAVGDVDGDGLAEAVFRAIGTGGQYTFLMDDQRADHETRGGYLHTDAWDRGFAIAVVDADGDGVKEVLSGKDLLDYNPRNGEWT